MAWFKGAKRSAVAIAVASALMLTGCDWSAPPPKPTASASPSPTAQPTPTAAPTATPTPPVPTPPVPTPPVPTPTVPSPPIPADGDYETDTDADGLPDLIEFRAGSDPSRADTDGDGLTDVEEIRAATDPADPDADGNGIADPADDPDGDGITTRDELSNGTQPYNSDSDADRLTDGDELARGSDPMVVDTDGDGVDDGDEVQVGSDPLRADADRAFTVAIAPEGVPASLTATGTPQALVSTTVELASEAEFSDIPGLVGTPVVVRAGEGLIEGTLTMSFDPASVAVDTTLAVMHYDERAGAYDRPGEQVIDIEAGTATVTTRDFSPFIVVDVEAFDAIWRDQIVVPREGADGTVQSVDSVLAIDSSGSMGWNDPEGLRTGAAKSFVDTLLDGDRAAVVDLDSYASLLQALTPDLEAVRAAIDRIGSSGGTDIGAAVELSLDELDAGGDPARGRIIVLLTDGEGDYDPALTARAADSDTTVYTVGLGDSVDIALLSEIAVATGGEFFLVDDADGLGDAYARIGADVGKPDSDGDGLSDEAETEGWPTNRGTVHKTDPADADSDGDGLSDGEEAGALGAAGYAYAGLSHPLLVDSDRDGLDDEFETSEGLRPLDADADRDTLNDFDELELGFDSLDGNADLDSFDDAAERANGTDPFGVDLDGEANFGAFLGGFVFGEWEAGARQFGFLSNAQLQSVSYLVGWLASGVVVLADVRDIAAALGKGAWGDALFNVAALVPAFGDAAKIGKSVATFSERGADASRAGRFTLTKPPTSGAMDASAVSARMAEIRRIVLADPIGARLPQDAAVRGRDARPPNEGLKASGEPKPVSRDAAQSRWMADEIARLDALGARNIRVDQRQVDFDGEYVGLNRPDLQYDFDGKHYIVELDRPTKLGSHFSRRGFDHYTRILANDPRLPDEQIRILTIGAPER